MKEKRLLKSEINGKLFNGAHNLENIKYGLLTALKRDLSKTDRVYWLCKCECGNICSVAARHLTSKRTNSCNDKIHRQGVNNNAWKGHGEIGLKHWNRILRIAKIRNCIPDFDIEYLWNLYLLQDEKCKLSGLPIFFVGVRSRETTASLDRIDSNENYIKSNIQWVHKDVNLMKSNLSEDKFVEICKLITEHNK